MDESILPSNRHFGIVFCLVFFGIGTYLYLNNSIIFGFVTLSLSVLLIFITWISPDALLPFNKMWMQLGIILGRVVSPIVLGILFFLLITPVGILARLVGRDELKIRQTPKDSYWAKKQTSEINFEETF